MIIVVAVWIDKLKIKESEPRASETINYPILPVFLPGSRVVAPKGTYSR